MSNSPTDPFQDDFQAGHGYAQSPPPIKSSGSRWLIGCGIVGMLGLLVCCGGGVFMTMFGINMLASEFQRQLDGNPVIVEHIGDIESMGMSWSATIEQAQKSDANEDELAFEIKGSKGSGIVLIQQDASGDGTGMQSATLVMPDGSRYPIEVAGSNDVDLDLDDMFDAGEPTAVDEPAATR